MNNYGFDHSWEHHKEIQQAAYDHYKTVIATMQTNQVHYRINQTKVYIWTGEEPTTPKLRKLGQAWSYKYKHHWTVQEQRRGLCKERKIHIARTAFSDESFKLKLEKLALSTAATKTITTRRNIL